MLKSYIPSIISVSFDHDYEKKISWCWNEYQKDVVIYIAGSIVRNIKQKINCEMCIESLESKENTFDLIAIKNKIVFSNSASKCSEKKKGLIYQSKDVIIVCKTAEKILRTVSNLFKNKNIVNFLSISARRLLLPVKIFDHLDSYIDKDIINSHKSKLIALILNKYFNIRLHHEAKSLHDSIQRILHFHSKIVLFKNQ